MYILFDIGGTKMRITLSRDGETFEEPKILDTPADFDAAMALIQTTVLAMTGGAKITAAGGGVAGKLLCTHGKGEAHANVCSTLLIGPHLAGWNGKAIEFVLEDILKAPVYMQNDASIVGLGEAVVGAGKGHEVVAYMTVSTGVGGARIVNQEIDLSIMGFEPGHQIIDASGMLCKNTVCGTGLDLEGAVSGSAITARYGKKPYEITDPIFWDEMARVLAYGLNNTIVHWSPDIVVIGGSMMKEIGIPIDRVRAHLRGILQIFPELPLIEKATLGDIGGLHGALAFIKQKHK